MKHQDYQRMMLDMTNSKIYVSLMTVKIFVDRQDLLSASEVASMLPDTSAQTVLRWAKQGRLPFVEMPSGRRGRKYFRREDIEALLTPEVAPAGGRSGGHERVGELPGQGVLSW